MYFYIFIGLLSAIVIAAIAFGGWPERIAAVACAAATGLSAWASTDTVTSWEHPQYALLAVDLALLGIVIWLVFRYDRYWTLLANASLVITVMAHISRLEGLELSSKAYAAMEGLPSLLTLIALALGIVEYRYRQRTGHCDKR